MKLLTKNKTKTDCGVIAAVNAAKWSGLNCTYGKVRKLALASGYSAEKGIYFFQFSNLLKKIGVPIKRIRPRSPKAMATKLRRGKMLVVFYSMPGPCSGHVLSCVLDHEGKIQLINPEPGKRHVRRTWMRFIRNIKENGTKEFKVYEIPHKRVASRNDDT